MLSSAGALSSLSHSTNSYCKPRCLHGCRDPASPRAHMGILTPLSGSSRDLHITQPAQLLLTCRALDLRHLLFVCCQCVLVVACEVPYAVPVVRTKRLCPQPELAARLCYGTSAVHLQPSGCALCASCFKAKLPKHVKFSSFH